MNSLNMEVNKTQQATELTCEIISVYKLLTDPALKIPQYQRPYKWTGKNINQLFSDIATHKDKSAYRLGTIVFHEEDRKKNIVDGQQRTISLMLAARALIKRNEEEQLKRNEEKQLKRNDLCDCLAELKKSMVNPSFTSEISQKNIHSNYLEVARIVSRSDFTEEHIDFFLKKCEVVVVSLKNVSEAFQFFDSQNARGRDLEPHDLLKAYHLREFSARDEHLKADTVAHWESCNTEQLASLFSQYLYRIRNWSKGASARYFSKDDSDLFKGVNIDAVASYPYVQQLRIAHHFVDDYNGQYERKIDLREMGFPFHLDQIIINGRRFFELVSHYQSKVARISAESWNGHELVGVEGLDGFAKDIMDTINSYPARTRSGDCYVRTMFDCLLICYIDKFGHAEISRAIEKIFIWAYSLRLQMQVVQLASMDNHVLENNMFQLIKEATRPADFINCSLPVLNDNNCFKSEKTAVLRDLFRDMKYYE